MLVLHEDPALLGPVGRHSSGTFFRKPGWDLCSTSSHLINSTSFWKFFNHSGDIDNFPFHYNATEFKHLLSSSKCKSTEKSERERKKSRCSALTDRI